MSRAGVLAEPRAAVHRAGALGLTRVPATVVLPLGAFIVSRVVAAAWIWSRARATGRTYSALATGWDGEWYRTIAHAGYPAHLPLDPAGHIIQNAWAFSPGYPFAVRAVMSLTGLGYDAAATGLSLLFGAAAMLVLHRLVHETAGLFCAGATVLLTCTFMSAPVLQLAYSESLALLLLCLVLLALRHRRYGGVVLLLLALGLTRPVVAALVPVVAVHVAVRWRARRSSPLSAAERRWLAGLLPVTLLSSALWPAIAGVCTGQPLAWFHTEESWVGPRHELPGTAWPAFFLREYGVAGLAAAVLIVAVSLAVALRRPAAAWGPEVRTWALAYPVYLLFATAPVPSVVRFLVLGFPLIWPVPEQPGSRRERQARVLLVACLAVVGLLMQKVWVDTYLAATAPSNYYP